MAKRVVPFSLIHVGTDPFHLPDAEHCNTDGPDKMSSSPEQMNSTTLPTALESDDTTKLSWKCDTGRNGHLTEKLKTVVLYMNFKITIFPLKGLH
jgi:hypothetical protein